MSLKTTNWTSVKEGLPPEMKPVLFFLPKGGFVDNEMFIGVVERGSVRRDDIEGVGETGVTHWIDLPSMPTELTPNEISFAAVQEGDQLKELFFPWRRR